MNAMQGFQINKLIQPAEWVTWCSPAVTGAAAAAWAPPVVVPRPLIPIVLLILPSGSLVRPVPLRALPVVGSLLPPTRALLRPRRPTPPRPRLVADRPWPFRALPRTIILWFIPIFILMRLFVIPTPRRLMLIVIIILLSRFRFVLLILIMPFRFRMRIFLVRLLRFFFLVFLLFRFPTWITWTWTVAFAFFGLCFDFRLLFTLGRLVASARWGILLRVTSGRGTVFFIISPFLWTEYLVLFARFSGFLFGNGI